MELTFEDFGPLEDARPFDTVFRESRGVGDRADGICCWWSDSVDLGSAKVRRHNVRSIRSMMIQQEG